MEYHKDQFAFTDRMEYLRAPLAVQGAHAWLVRHCARRENGGRIRASSAWRDREWEVATSGQLGLRNVVAVVKAGLARWDRDDLVVEGYDALGEVACKRERERARRNRERQEGSATSTESEDTLNRTRTRTRTVRDPVQTSPDQTISSQPPPLKGAAGEEGKHPRARPAPPSDPLGEQLGRYRAAATLTEAIKLDGGEVEIANAAPSIGAAFARLIDPSLKTRRSPEDIEILRAWWATVRASPSATRHHSPASEATTT